MVPLKLTPSWVVSATDTTSRLSELFSFITLPSRGRRMAYTQGPPLDTREAKSWL